MCMVFIRKDVIFLAYSTKYRGTQIDEALERGRNIRVVNNGWIKLDSSSNSPTDLGSLKNPGNYTTTHWTDGPDLGSINVSHINVSVTRISGKLYQFADIIGEKYYRYIISSEDIYGKWNIDQTVGSINPGPNSPSNPTDGVTIWLDTSDSSKPVLKLYYNENWINILPYGTMTENIYDSQGKKTDIFKYIDEAFAATDITNGQTDFYTHIHDANIHSTKEDKEKWDSAATMNDVNAAMDSLKPSINTQISTLVNQSIDNVTTLTSSVTHLQDSVNEHINDSEIHPNIVKQSEWDAKCDAVHTHYLDGNVTISPKNIIGVIPSEMLPYDVKERVYEVNSIQEMYDLPKNPIHNGDVICVSSNGDSDWYFVVNDQYLGTVNAHLAFKQFSAGAIPDVSWSSISGTPTTIEGYGITNAATKEDIEEIEIQISTLEAELSGDLNLSGTADAQTTYNKAIDNLEIIDNAMSVLENTISKLEYISK